MTWEEHLEHLEKFLQTISTSGLTLNLNKCSFGKGKTSFVSHMVGSGSIGPDPGETATLDEIQAPQMKKDVRRIMGFFSYFRNFIPALAETARPITDLTRGNVPNRVPWAPNNKQP